MSLGTLQVFNGLLDQETIEEGPITHHIVVPADDAYKAMSKAKRAEFRKNFRQSYMQTHGTPLKKEFDKNVAMKPKDHLHIRFHFGYEGYFPTFEHADASSGGGLGYMPRRASGGEKGEMMLRTTAGIAEYISKHNARGGGHRISTNQRNKFQVVISKESFGVRGIGHREGAISVSSLDDPVTTMHEFAHTAGGTHENADPGTLGFRGTALSDSWFRKSEYSDKNRRNMQKHFRIS
jgi:hypothetical protein